jgi:predicted XRE-type DNA-binding protein
MGSEPAHITRGSVFDDLGFTAEEVLELKVKSDLWDDLHRIVDAKKLTQKELGKVLGIHQPEVSLFLNGRISKFSVGKLIQFAVRLGLDVNITLTKPLKARDQSFSGSRTNKVGDDGRHTSVVRKDSRPASSTTKRGSSHTRSAAHA